MPTTLPHIQSIYTENSHCKNEYSSVLTATLVSLPPLLLIILLVPHIRLGSIMKCSKVNFQWKPLVRMTPNIIQDHAITSQLNTVTKAKQLAVNNTQPGNVTR